MSSRVMDLQFASAKLVGYLRGLITVGEIDPAYRAEIQSRIDDVSFANSNISAADYEIIQSRLQDEMVHP